jgi:hypothetical protein
MTLASTANWTNVSLLLFPLRHMLLFAGLVLRSAGWIEVFDDLIYGMTYS